MQLKNFINLLKPIIIILWVTIIYYIFSLFPLFTNFNNTIIYKFVESNTPINKNLIVIKIDNKTLNNLWFPLDRKYITQFLQNINSAKPAVVWFDIFFADKWTNPKADEILSETISTNWNIILGWFRDDTKYSYPYDKFLNSCKKTAYLTPPVPTNWGTVKMVNPFVYLKNNKNKLEAFEFFPFALTREYYSFMFWKDFSFNSEKINKENYIFWKNNIYFEDFKQNIEPSIYHAWDINYPEFNIIYRSPNDFNRLSFNDVYSWSYDKNLLKDKIVLVWYDAPWVKDDFIIPKFWVVQWMYIHANVINNILNWEYLFKISKFVEVLLFLLINLVVYYIVTSVIKIIRLFKIVILFLSIFVIFSLLFIFLTKNNILLNFPIQFIIWIIITFIVVILTKYMNENKNKIRLNKALSEYVSTDIANEILHWTWNVNLSWERKKITTFFSDLAWFTTLSEKLSPEELVWFLRWYLWEMSWIIMDNKWFINKYEWDAIMALWWVFWSTWETASYDACLSAIVQQKQIYLMNQKRLENWESEVWVRMWINCWDAIIGNIGREWRKMEFTALWDSVNLASRLEGVNKFYGTAICVSQSVYEEVKDKFEFRYLDKIRVKWKNEPINIYELVALKWELSDMKKQIFTEFDKAIELYISRNFDKALEIFKQLSEIWDKPSATYKNRCALYLENPPLESWDLVWTMNEK